MTTSRSTLLDGRGATRVAAGLAFVVGLALAGWGTSLHLRIAGQVAAGRCDGCAPWHPLVVVAPIVVGSLLVVLAGFVASRR